MPCCPESRAPKSPLPRGQYSRHCWGPPGQGHHFHQVPVYSPPPLFCADVGWPMGVTMEYCCRLSYGHTHGRDFAEQAH